MLFCYIDVSYQWNVDRSQCWQSRVVIWVLYEVFSFFLEVPDVDHLSLRHDLVVAVDQNNENITLVDFNIWLFCSWWKWWRKLSGQSAVHVHGSSHKKEYEQQTKQEIQEAKEDIENVSQKIYANVLTLMGVLVAVFSLISINYQAFTNAEITMPYILVMNLSMTLCVVIMLGLILIFINNAKNKKFIGIYVAALLVLVIAVIALCISIL